MTPLQLLGSVGASPETIINASRTCNLLVGIFHTNIERAEVHTRRTKIMIYNPSDREPAIHLSRVSRTTVHTSLQSRRKVDSGAQCAYLSAQHPRTTRSRRGTTVLPEGMPERSADAIEALPAGTRGYIGGGRMARAALSKSKRRMFAFIGSRVGILPEQVLAEFTGP